MIGHNRDAYLINKYRHVLEMLESEDIESKAENSVGKVNSSNPMSTFEAQMLAIIKEFIFGKPIMKDLERIKENGKHRSTK